MAWRRRLRWFERGALVTGLLCLGLWAHASYRSWAYQSAESRKLAARAREAPPAKPVRGSEPDVEQPAAAAPGITSKSKPAAVPVASIGRIEIPRLGIRAMVAEGTDAPTLELAVGHIPETAAPGSPGNCGLAGHRDTFFRRLEGVREGDRVHFSTAEKTHTYEVEWSQVVEPDRVDTLDPTPVPSLTLVTCYPFTYVGRAPKRFVVRARQVDAADGTVAARAGKPRTARARATGASPILMAAGR
jgi:sortase A